MSSQASKTEPNEPFRREANLYKLKVFFRSPARAPTDPDTVRMQHTFLGPFLAKREEKKCFATNGDVRQKRLGFWSRCGLNTPPSSVWLCTRRAETDAFSNVSHTHFFSPFLAMKSLPRPRELGVLQRTHFTCHSSFFLQKSPHLRRIPIEDGSYRKESLPT